MWQYIAIVLLPQFAVIVSDKQRLRDWTNGVLNTVCYSSVYGHCFSDGKILPVSFLEFKGLKAFTPISSPVLLVLEQVITLRVQVETVIWRSSGLDVFGFTEDLSMTMKPFQRSFLRLLHFFCNFFFHFKPECRCLLSKKFFGVFLARTSCHCPKSMFYEHNVHE